MEEDYIKSICAEIIQHKQYVVITEKGLSDLSMHFLTKAGISAIRRLRKTDNNRISRACGATIVHRAEGEVHQKFGQTCPAFADNCRQLRLFHSLALVPAPSA